MNDREHAANDDLQILADAYRLGRIPRDEYRARRRHVFAGLRGDPGSSATHGPEPDGRPDEARRSPTAASSRDEARADISSAVSAAQRSGTPLPGLRKHGWRLAIMLLILAALLLAVSQRAPA